MKNRLNRVNEVLKRELSTLIRREFTFQAKLGTVQEVDITPDLKSAHIYIGVIGTPEEQHAAMAQLHDARQRLQHELSRRVILKFTPHLHFQLDQAGERGDRILQILEDLHLPPETAAPATDDDKT
ncbi:MAG: 30S ribosome-binding factor RbfA [Chthoniobacteraceae bacterium]